MLTLRRLSQLLLLSLLILPQLVLADVRPEVETPVDTHVVQIIPPENGPENSNDTYLVLLASFGRVLHLASGSLRADARELLEAVAGTERRVRVDFRGVGESDILLSIQEIAPAPLPEVMQAEPETQDTDIDEIVPPAPLRTSSASDLFYFMRSKHLRPNAECFHRAYLWAYDTWTQRGEATQKVFLFFTRRYLRDYNYKWWFHVTPYVMENGSALVLDATYANGPLYMQTWTNIFIANDSFCPEITAYRGWQAHYQDRYCYRRLVSMYYYHPNSVLNADRNGYVITAWDQRGLRNSQAARP